jgi:hypothetical protein
VASLACPVCHLIAARSAPLASASAPAPARRLCAEKPSSLSPVARQASLTMRSTACRKAVPILRRPSGWPDRRQLCSLASYISTARAARPSRTRPDRSADSRPARLTVPEGQQAVNRGIKSVLESRMTRRNPTFSYFRAPWSGFSIPRLYRISGQLRWPTNLFDQMLRTFMIPGFFISRRFCMLGRGCSFGSAGISGCDRFAD